MGYILDLRKTVGHRPLIQVGASVIIVDRDGRTLLEKRTDNGCWGYAGGSVDLDENVETAAAREMLEETGLEAKSLTLFGIFSGPEYHYTYPNGDEVSNVDIVFICDDYSGEIKCQEDEVSELKFFAPADIPDNINPPVRIPLLKWRDMMLGKADKK